MRGGADLHQQLLRCAALEPAGSGQGPQIFVLEGAAFAVQAQLVLAGPGAGWPAVPVRRNTRRPD